VVSLGGSGSIYADKTQQNQGSLISPRDLDGAAARFRPAPIAVDRDPVTRVSPRGACPARPGEFCPRHFDVLDLRVRIARVVARENVIRSGPAV